MHKKSRNKEKKMVLFLGQFTVALHYYYSQVNSANSLRLILPLNYDAIYTFSVVIKHFIKALFIFDGCFNFSSLSYSQNLLVIRDIYISYQ